MKLHPLVAIACALVNASACGTIESSGEGSTTMLQPLLCAYGNETYEEGEEFDTPGGCVRYLCEEGSLTALTDNRVTVSGDLALTTQQDVDTQVCLSVVEGTLSISGTAATLTPLITLERVGGNLDITASEAVTLGGLEGITQIDGNITVADNPALTSLGFQPYMSAFGDITIQNNDALTWLDGAEFIGQCGWCSTAAEERVARVTTMHRDADQAPAGDGGAQAEVGDGATDGGGGGSYFGKILIADNDVLTDITALNNLVYAWDDVRFRNNAALSGINTLPLFEVQGDLEISDHAAMNAADAESYAAGIEVWGLTTLCGNLGGTPCE